MIRVELIRRPQQSALFSALSPFIAFALTLIAGAILFWLIGKPPLPALYSYFIEPLTEIWSVHELIIKATPLILIAVGLSVCYISNNWNIGAEGQFIAGAMAIFAWVARQRVDNKSSARPVANRAIKSAVAGATMI